MTKRSLDHCVFVSLDELLHLSHDAKLLSFGSLRSNGPRAGLRVSRLLARGMEFAESRHYQAGDDIRAIDWRVTARTGKTHTKLFAAEKERPVFLAIDMRSPMFFATQGVFKSVQASLIAGHLAWNCAHSGDRLGGMIFDNEKILEYRSALGKKGVLPLLNGLANQNQIREQTAPLSPITMDLAIARLRKRASPGSLIFLISDFRHFSPQAYNGLQQLSQHCDLFLFFIYDPLEQSLPKNGNYPITDGTQILNINTYDKNLRDAYTQQFIERLETIKKLAKLKRVSQLECRTIDDSLNILMHHFGR